MKTASGTAELPGIRTEQLGEINTADPRSSGDLSEHPLRERSRFEVAALAGQALATQRRNLAVVASTGDGEFATFDRVNDSTK